jgi:hypothetical protein
MVGIRSRCVTGRATDSDDGSGSTETVVAGLERGSATAVAVSMKADVESASDKGRLRGNEGWAHRENDGPLYHGNEGNSPENIDCRGFEDRLWTSNLE